MHPNVHSVFIIDMETAQESVEMSEMNDKDVVIHIYVFHSLSWLSSQIYVYFILFYDLVYIYICIYVCL